jgi:hypothetical protein
VKVKKTGMILMLAILLPLSAFAGQKKQQDGTEKQQPDGTDWLNAPTPDGSPTLKETSDWLAKTLQDYGGSDSGLYQMVSGVRIDNNCTLSYNEDEDNGSSIHFSVPLGAITNVEADTLSEDGEVGAVTLRTGQVAAVDLRSSDGNRRRPRTSALVANMAEIDILRTPHAHLGGELPQTRQQIIPRVVSALQHAVSLCRSTHQAPAQSNEPF